MELHKLLQRQLNKFFPDQINSDIQFENFIKAISESYTSYERDKELSNHAFGISEREYNEINLKLKSEIDSKKISILKLNETIREMDSTIFMESEDNLIGLVDYVKKLIDKSRNIEFELVQNVKRMSALISNMHSGVLVENEMREIIFTNEAFCKMFDINASPTSMIGMDCTQSAEYSKALFKDPELFIKRVEELMQNKLQVNGEILELKDGRFFERDFVPVFVDNEFKGHMWNYSDVTEKKIILDVVAESETKNRLIMNSALDAIISINDHGLITFWNPQAEKIFGWKEEEVLNKSLSEVIIPEKYVKNHERGMASYRANKEGPLLEKLLELKTKHKLGHEFPVELSITPIHFDGKVFFCSFIRDISERKLAEQVLAKSEEKYRSIIANMNLGLLEVDNKDVIRFCNQSFSIISGYSFEEMIGRRASDIFIEVQNKNVIEEKRKNRKNGISDSYELFVKNKLGEDRCWLISGAPNINEKGKVIGSIGIHLDITEKKKLEKEIEIALEKAQIASNAKETFLANMSHEIRTPLNAIIGMVRELGRESLTPKQITYLSNSETAAKHLLSMVNNVLDMSKIEAGAVKFVENQFNLISVVKMVESILFIKAKEKDLVLRTSLSPDIKMALIGDSSRIRQILINIVDNAIKFTQAGEVVLAVEVLSTTETQQNIHFKITDTGIGMSKQFINHIFEKFSQEDVNSSRKVQGTGLGMAITQEIVNKMGGHLEIQSEQGVGTSVEFILSLPIGDSSSILSTLNLTIDESLAGLNCLLVEDNDMNRMIALKSLQAFGCKVTEATDGLMAIHLLRSESFDFILMDIQMPKMDGIETTKFIRNELNLITPIIALTANVFKSDIDLYLSVGMNEYVTKPYEEENLFTAIVKSLKLKNKKNDIEKFFYPDRKLYDLVKLYEMSRGDDQFVLKMVKLFIEQTPIAIIELKRAFYNKDLSRIGKIAHRIKPSIEIMGMDNGLKLIAEIQLQLLESKLDINTTEGLVLELEQMIEQVILKLNKLV
ncbi:MAG: PAS domain S-box protein [bacterium]|nr:PAS domain S-box protein [bacterium]